MNSQTNNKIKQLRIEHYKGFFEEQSIEFAIPNYQNNGSGLTLIVGPNNSGKTTVIESLLLSRSKMFTKGERHQGYSPKVTIEKYDGYKYTFSNNRGAQVEVTPDNKKEEITFDIIPSRRYWSHKSFSSKLSIESFFSDEHSKSVRNSRDAKVADTLKLIEGDDEQYKELTDLMKQIIPHFKEWTIDAYEQDGSYISYKIGDIEHTAEFLGDGIISLFRICLHLLKGNKGKVLIIDEPELSLHPVAQKNLSRLLSEQSRTKQIIVCTHSPYFVNWEDFRNGAQFVRLNKVGAECISSMLKKETKYSEFLDNNILEWQKPQLLDIAAKEILFTEKILFVEGQEDVGLIKKWMHESGKPLNFDIFGYGVGGYRNMTAFLNLAKDLNLSKVTCLYDSGKEASESYEKNKNEFTDYHFAQLPTKDIRDKTKNGKEIKGCFDEHGNLREKEFEQVMNKIIEYFSD